MKADSSPEKLQRRLLNEQAAYYRAAAQEYGDHALPLPGRDEIVAALDAFRPTGSVLELACGPGTWTHALLRHAVEVTAVDNSPEMLEIAAGRISDSRVQFLQADIFGWTPDRRYDVVFFGFWLSHVPLERFGEFWNLVDRCLEPDGRVCFVDDNYRTPEELIEGEVSSTILRRLNDGTAFRVVKVPHEPLRLQEQLAELGWRIVVRSTAGPFYWGAGMRA